VSSPTPATLPTTQPKPITVGQQRIVPLLDAAGPFLVATDVYPQIAPNELAAALDAHGDEYSDPTRTRLRMAVQGFLILGAGRTIVVDTCLGGPKPRRSSPVPGFVSRWLTTLRQAGVTPEAVDTLIITHLHHDHVGWNTTPTRSGRLQPTFPNARYLVARDEYQFFTSERARPLLDRRGDYVADSVQPVAVARQLDLVPTDHRVDDEIRLVPAPGHTPGHVLVEVASAAQRAVLAADLVHHPLQLRHPEISSAMCVDPEASAESRWQILDRYADTGAYFLASHLPRGGHIRRHGSGYALTRLPSSSYVNDEHPAS
jgi:glyoxylase-like metal-dependent hydrolase (beta-lactamase superfamily II)